MIDVLVCGFITSYNHSKTGVFDYELELCTNVQIHLRVLMAFLCQSFFALVLLHVVFVHQWLLGIFLQAS